MLHLETQRSLLIRVLSFKFQKAFNGTIKHRQFDTRPMRRGVRNIVFQGSDGEGSNLVSAFDDEAESRAKRGRLPLGNDIVVDVGKGLQLSSDPS